MNVIKNDLAEVAMLLIDNSHTSASREGLIHRERNRRKAIDELLYMLNLTAEEAEDNYWEWIKRKGE